jgi:ankyrin repeat protein
LNLNADPNSKNEFGNTALHKAFMIEVSNEIINMLINKQAIIEALNDFN